MSKETHKNKTCYCGSGQPFRQCCQPLLEGVPAASPEALMRSRYTAYVLSRDDYIMQTWHAPSRPPLLQTEARTKWLSLKVIHAEHSATQGHVEFVAKYKINGKAHTLHERSRFLLENGRWYYVDGELFDEGNLS